MKPSAAEPRFSPPELMEQRTPPIASTRRAPAQVAGWAFIVTGIGHGLATVMPWPDGARATAEAMERTFFSLGGISRSMDQLMSGFSFAMVPLFVAFGAAVLLLLRKGGLPREIAWLGLALSVSLLAIALLLLPTPPIVTMTIATCAFALSLRP